MSKQDRIYLAFYEKAMEEGATSEQADTIAREAVEELYWERVDRGRQQAKDKNND